MLDQIIAAPAEPGLCHAHLVATLGKAGVWPISCL
jgi:hypothetical protein